MLPTRGPSTQEKTRVSHSFFCSASGRPEKKHHRRSVRLRVTSKVAGLLVTDPFPLPRFHRGLLLFLSRDTLMDSYFLYAVRYLIAKLTRGCPGSEFLVAFPLDCSAASSLALGAAASYLEGRSRRRSYTTKVGRRVLCHSSIMIRQSARERAGEPLRARPTIHAHGLTRTHARCPTTPSATCPRPSGLRRRSRSKLQGCGCGCGRARLASASLFGALEGAAC